MPEPITPVVPAAPVVPATPSPVVSVPTVPATERLSVPVSAIFGEDDLKYDKGTPAPVNNPAATSPITPAPAVPVEGSTKKDEPVAPAAPAAPVEGSTKKEEPVAPAAPAAPEKVKVGGKEYTVAELEAALAEKAKPTAPVAPVAPTAAAPVAPPPTKEQVAQQETEWVGSFVKGQKQNLQLSSDEVETLLSGGEDAAKLLDNKFNEVIARAVLLARKGIYAEMNPTLAQLQNSIQPLLTQAQSVEAVAAEAQFIQIYPEFAQHLDVARDVGNALIKQFPKQFLSMTREQQLNEVASQASRILQDNYKRFNPAATNTWKDALKTTATPVAAAPVIAAAPVAPAAAPVAPAAASAPVVPAPAANSPAATPTGGASPNWHKETAKSLTD